MQIVFAIAFVVLLILFFVAISGRRESLITEKVESLGGTLISVERRNFFTGLGPFMVVGKGRSVYRFEYSVKNNRKEGWVRFGGLLGPDWRL